MMWIYMGPTVKFKLLVLQHFHNQQSNFKLINLCCFFKIVKRMTTTNNSPTFQLFKFYDMSDS